MVGAVGLGQDVGGSPELEKMAPGELVELDKIAGKGGERGRKIDAAASARVHRSGRAMAGNGGKDDEECRVKDDGEGEGGGGGA